MQTSTAPLFNVRFISLSDYIALLSVRMPIVLYPTTYLSVCPNCVSVCLSVCLLACCVSRSVSRYKYCKHNCVFSPTRHRTTPHRPVSDTAPSQSPLRSSKSHYNCSKFDLNPFDGEMSLSASAQGGFDQPSPPKSPVDPGPVVSCFLPNKLYSVVSAKLLGGFELVLLHSPWHGASECWTGVHPSRHTYSAVL